MTSAVHVVGAGLAGLAAATRLAEAGLTVRVHEAAGAAGGRCRSYDDPELGCRLDNGNHLLLSGNRAALDYLRRIGAADTLAGPAEPAFPFLDLRDGRRWVLRPNAGPVPTWLFRAERRVPGTRPWDYAEGVRLALAGTGETVGALVAADSPLRERFWRPFTVAALNTELDEASARCLWQVVRRTFGQGGGACRPLVPREGLSESFVDPALAYLAARGAEVGMRRRLRGIGRAGQAVRALDFGTDKVAVGPDDSVILAVPPWIAGAMLPELDAPQAFRAILNVHFRTEVQGFAWPDFLGLVGGLAEWVFAKPGVVSVTVSAADRVIDAPAEELARQVWSDLARAFDADPHAVPPWRVVKEKRATFAATPDQVGARPGPRTSLGNLWLAGDWTATDLPATIEGAIESGFAAARCVLDRAGAAG